MSKKFLDKTGVSLLWLKIKQKFLHNVSTQVADGDIVLFSGTGGAEVKSGGSLTNLVDTVSYNTSDKKLQSKKVGGTATDVVTAAKIVTDGGGATGISFNGAQYSPKDDGTVSLPSLKFKEDGVTAATTTANSVTTYTVNRYGECATEAATATKEVTLTSGTLSLVKGARVTVKFTANAKNTANSPKLKVGTLDAIPISYDGAVISSGANKGYLVGVREFVYDGTNWCLTSANDTEVISENNIKNDASTASGLITGQRFTVGFNDRLAGSIIDPTALETGTDEDAAVVSAKVLNDWLAGKLQPIQDTLNLITGDDEESDEAINKWNEVVTFLDGIGEDSKLEDLMATAGRRDIFHASCDTAAGTAAKTCSLAGFDLNTGNIVAVKFKNTNTASNPTLNINNTGAKSIVYGNTAIGTAADTLDYAGRANATILYMFNGTSYVWLGWSYEPESLTSSDIDAAVASAESNS